MDVFTFYEDMSLVPHERNAPGMGSYETRLCKLTANYTDGAWRFARDGEPWDDFPGSPEPDWDTAKEQVIERYQYLIMSPNNEM